MVLRGCEIKFEIGQRGLSEDSDTRGGLVKGKKSPDESFDPGCWRVMRFCFVLSSGQVCDRSLSGWPRASTGGPGRESLSSLKGHARPAVQESRKRRAKHRLFCPGLKSHPLGVWSRGFLRNRIGVRGGRNYYYPRLRVFLWIVLVEARWEDDRFLIVSGPLQVWQGNRMRENPISR